MKELFKLLAEYNLQTNHAMLQILEKLPPEKLTTDVGSYYKSILGILNHMLGANINWIRRISGLIPELEKIRSGLPEVSYGSSLIWVTLDDLKKVLTEMDIRLKKMVELIPEAKFSERLAFTTFKGEKMDKSTYHMLLQVFNHQTHNRGMIAALLDQMGIENDYSNIIALKA